ncbi:hypothetical protein [Leclercia adecarboxylata]|uniref:hypothetical protein n=1 Tax=Leclercia adecarboxylata TaxID=83655 RepID=UPI0013FE1FB1|nr:hypothetical protein [Leclercia adecarboxylata]QIM43337.1 hypothetical protein G7098_11515 [Leclercia adecarboxylata]
MEIIFNGKAIQVMIDRVSDNHGVVFSFASFNAHNHGGPAYGNGFLQKNGFTAVFFTTKINCWWQTKEFDEAIEIVNKLTENIKRRITYGQSMGGYGALLASGLLNSLALVTSPQTNITNKNIPLHPAWKEHISNHPLIRDDVEMQIKKSASVIVVYDPANSIDHKHYSYIATQPNVHRLIIPFSTHNVPQCMLEMGILSEVMVSLLKNDLAAINESRRKIRTKRLLSPTYVTRASRYVLSRKSQLIKKLFFNALIRSLSNPDFLGCDLSHIREILSSDNYKNNWIKTSLNIDGFSIEGINHIDIVDPRFALFKSTGNDPQLIVKSQSGALLKTIAIHINSSVKSTAAIYYSLKEGARQYNSNQVLVQPVSSGYNKLTFTIPDECNNPEVRFDPLTHEGLFSITSISLSK